MGIEKDDGFVLGTFRVSLLTERDTSHDTSLIFDDAYFRRNRKSIASDVTAGHHRRTRGAIFEIAPTRTTTMRHDSTTDKTDWSVRHRVSCSLIVVDSTCNFHMYVRYIRTVWLYVCMYVAVSAAGNAIRKCIGPCGLYAEEIFGNASWRVRPECEMGKEMSW